MPPAPAKPPAAPLPAEALRELALYRKVFDEIPDVVLLKDDKGDFLLCNQTVARLYGTTPEAMVGKHDGDFGVPPEMADFFRQNVLAIMARAEAEVVFEDSRDARSGEIRHFKSIKRPFKDDEGRNRILVIAHDITDVVRAQQRTADSEARLNLALAGAGMATWDWHIPSGALHFNARWAEMQGLPLEELPPRIESWNTRVCPADIPLVRTQLERHFSGESPIYEATYRIRHRDGHWVWVQAWGKLVEWRDSGEPQRLIGTALDITERKEAEEQIKQLAFYDPLTGLPNRRLLHERLQQVQRTHARSRHHGALLFIDLDHFKTLNDTLGHDQGDLLLQQVAARLAHCVRKGDTVTRLGGDEFVVMLESLGAQRSEAAQHAEAVGETIVTALNHPYALRGHDYRCTPSIGITVFSNQPACLDELLKQADLAMYQAKAAGRNTLRFFDQGMQAVVDARAQLEKELREGLESGQFALHYQAQIDERQGLCGAEALLRWRHPLRGVLLPQDFLPLAEQTGLLLPLGRWVLEAACTRLAAWAQGPATAHLSLAVNVGVQQFRQPDFVRQVQDVLARSGAAPHRLKLELTESLLMDNVEDSIAKMSALQACGVRFTVDDFGTGHSSLNHLTRLPLERLTIDRSFVREVLADPHAAAIVRTIIALARSLALEVIAEGVETAAQRDFLSREGCQVFQGELFSPALSQEAFEDLARRTWQPEALASRSAAPHRPTPSLPR